MMSYLVLALFFPAFVSPHMFLTGGRALIVGPWSRSLQTVTLWERFRQELTSDIGYAHRFIFAKNILKYMFFLKRKFGLVFRKHALVMYWYAVTKPTPIII